MRTQAPEHLGILACKARTVGSGTKTSILGFPPISPPHPHLIKMFFFFNFVNAFIKYFLVKRRFYMWGKVRQPDKGGLRFSADEQLYVRGVICRWAGLVLGRKMAHKLFYVCMTSSQVKAECSLLASGHLEIVITILDSIVRYIMHSWWAVNGHYCEIVYFQASTNCEALNKYETNKQTKV